MSDETAVRTALRIHRDDNVACLLRDHQAGERPVADGAVLPAVTGDVPTGHKIALVAIARGEVVIKYGQPIGRATRSISPGDHVHLHNVQGLSRGDVA